MLDKLFEERINIKFRVKLKKTSTGTFSILGDAYGGNTLSSARVFEGRKRFTGGRQDVEEVGPVTMKTDENVEQVRTLVRASRHLGMRTIAEELNAEKRDQICGLMVAFCTKTTHRHTK